MPLLPERDRYQGCPLPPLHFEARGLPRSKAVIFPVFSPALSALWTPPGLFCALFSGRRKENQNFFRKKYCFFGRVMILYQSRHDATEYGRLAQLVEHLLDVQEVTGSSPVPSTKRKPLTKVRGFFLVSATVSRQSRTVQDSNRAAARSAVSNSPVGCCLARGSWTRRNVYQGRTNPILYEKGFGYVFYLQEVLRKGYSAHKPECERMRR